MIRFLVSVLTLHAQANFVASVAIDNGVEGEPLISCGANEVSFSVTTKNPFEGKIFVKGEYGRLECTTNGSASVTQVELGGTSTIRPRTPSPLSPTPAQLTTGIAQCPPCPAVCPSASDTERSRLSRQPNKANPNSAQLIVRIGTCNMKRERSLNPTGVTLSLTVVVSFHHQFITKVDKAYQLRCFYMETDKTVTSVVDVSMLQTTELSSQPAMPVCGYSIRRSSPDGPEIQYAKVGDMVYHRWECTSPSSGMFGMLVHSCYVDDGKGQRVEVINKTGCSMDLYVIGDLNYESSLYAYVEAHVFKFADRPVLDFQCAINICVKEGDGCKGITPPICPGHRRARRDINHSIDFDYVSDLNTRNDWDLHAQRLTVVDLDDNVRSEELARFEKAAQISSGSQAASLSHPRRYEIEHVPAKSTFCLSVAAFGVLVSICTFVLTVSTAVFTALYFLRHKH